MIAIAITDLDWYEFIKEHPYINLFNFWTPTPWNVKKLKEGDKVYFMLKSPIRKIGGYGHYVEYKNLTAEQAWETYGQGNGLETLEELLDKCSKYVSKHTSKKNVEADSDIGCLILEDITFYNEDEFFNPEIYGDEYAFPNQIVKLKYCNVDFIAEEKIQVFEENEFELLDHSKKNKTRKGLVNRRDGQQKFRKIIMKKYNNVCSITGETSKEILEAAHIQPYINEESNHPQNGILLRVDIHRLFDLGLIAVNTDYKILVSSHLKSNNYKSLIGKAIQLPSEQENWPSQKALKYHLENVFRT
jgi:putative restriction endonuclease